MPITASINNLIEATIRNKLTKNTVSEWGCILPRIYPVATTKMNASQEQLLREADPPALFKHVRHFALLAFFVFDGFLVL